ncbi:MAG: hypothetical protein ACRD2C_28320, partial [Acidimicrobiales bacterium]
MGDVASPAPGVHCLGKSVIRTNRRADLAGLAGNSTSQGAILMFAAYTLVDVFLSMLWFTLFVMW